MKTREQRKQRNKRVISLILMLLFALAVCAGRCLACDGAAAEAEGWTRFLLILGAATLTDILMRAAFWLDGVKR